MTAMDSNFLQLLVVGILVRLLCCVHCLHLTALLHLGSSPRVNLHDAGIPHHLEHLVSCLIVADDKGHDMYAVF